MAETAKQRKRVKRTFFDDSDDDFAEQTPTPPQQDGLKKKLKKKKKKEEKPVVYTSTQVEVTPRATRGRGSPEEKRFQQELEEALRMSVDETTSSIELASVGHSSNPSILSSVEHGPSSADTIMLEENITERVEVNKNSCDPEPVVKEISEKEMFVADKKSTAADIDDADGDIDEDFRDEVPEPAQVKKIDSKSVKKKKKEDWVINPVKNDKITLPKENIISVVADVHRNAGEESGDSQDGCDERVVVSSRPASRLSNEVKKCRAAVVTADEDIAVASPAPVPESDDLPRKRKRKARIIDSDSESDFGDAEIKSDEENDENSVDYAAEESEDEYMPSKKKKAEKKKKTPPKKSPKKKSPAKKSNKSPQLKNTRKSPKLASEPVCDQVNNPEPIVNRDKPMKVDVPKMPPVGSPKLPASAVGSPKPLSTRHVNVPEPVKPDAVGFTKVTKLTNAFTPVQAKTKPVLGNSSGFSKVKIPAWTPPAKVAGSNRLSSSSPHTGSNLSPAIGLRVGLSRNMRVSKPLHNTVKKVD